MKRRFRERVVLTGLAVTATWLVTFSWVRFAYSETAQVLPEGRSRFSFIYAQTDGINAQFDEGGNRESLTQPYNMNLDSQTIQNVSSDIKSLVHELNSTGLHYNAAKQNDAYHGISKDPDGPLIGDALSRGFLNVNAQAYRQQYVMSYQYGLTDKLSIGFAVPIIKMQVSGDATITGTNTADYLAQYYQSSQQFGQLVPALKTIAAVNRSTLQTLLTSHDYSDATSWNRNGLGDVVLGGRYNYLDSSRHLWVSSFQGGASAPTGSLKDPGEPLSVDFGQGAWDLEVANIINFNPTNWLTFSNSLHYGHHLKSDRELRVDAYPGEFLPTAADQEDVSMQLGDKYEINMGMDLNLTKGIKFTTSYDWFWKGKDVYSGSRNIDYSYLSDETGEYETTVQAGVSLSSIPAYMKSEFPAPMDVAFNIYIPTGGRNIPITPYGTAELALYF